MVELLRLWLLPKKGATQSSVLPSHPNGNKKKPCNDYSKEGCIKIAKAGKLCSALTVGRQRRSPSSRGNKYDGPSTTRVPHAEEFALLSAPISKPPLSLS